MNRLIAVMIASLFPLAVFAQASDCNSHKSIAVAQAQIDETLQAIGDDPGNRKAHLDSQLEAKAATLGWSKERQTELRTQAFSSAAFWAFEKEKQPYIAALAKAVASSSGPDSRTSKCEAARQVKSLAKKLAEVNGRQYGYAAREIGLTGNSAK
jgi:hypothetical protein